MTKSKSYPHARAACGAPVAASAGSAVDTLFKSKTKKHGPNHIYRGYFEIQ
jgi:hypothetical protein